jgi:PAS domain S-box-containing protein
MAEKNEILIVDDAPAVLKLLTDILSAEGFQVRSAETGELALRSVAAKPPRLILLDIHLPGMDGLEVCRRLKGQKESREIPILFISGLDDLEVKVKGFGLGAVDFISKPFQLEELLARVRTHLELSRLRKSLEIQVAIKTAELRKSTEAILCERDFCNVIINSLPGIFYLFDQTGRFLRWNKNFEQVIGYFPEEIEGMHPLDLFVGPDKALIRERIEETFVAGVSGAEAELIAKSGKRTPYYFTGHKIYIEWKHCLIGMGIDITERKRTEEALVKSEERFRVVAESTNDFIFEENFETGQLEWFGKAIEKLKDQLGEIPHTETAYEKMIHPDDRDRIVGEVKRHIWSREPFREEYRLIGKDGNILDLLSQGICLWDERGKPYKWIGALSDITERKKKEEELKQSLDKLHKAMGGIIQAMALAVETRDPFTAGHQRRVANLARSIGQEMGLTKDQVEAIRMAGMVHDLGKISIPAEILGKPTKLTALEFSLIKVHPQTGYDILKDIDFPWPIARIVSQHHERIDGSGYPLGLKDQEIVPEAKVLMVADVVEAIASHRPYRAAHGIDVALDEISQNKGLLYDPEVVDVCLRLFREQGFILE